MYTSHDVVFAIHSEAPVVVVRDICGCHDCVSSLRRNKVQTERVIHRNTPRAAVYAVATSRSRSRSTVFAQYIETQSHTTMLSNNDTGFHRV